MLEDGGWNAGQLLREAQDEVAKVQLHTNTSKSVLWQHDKASTLDAIGYSQEPLPASVELTSCYSLS